MTKIIISILSLVVIFFILSSCTRDAPVECKNETIIKEVIKEVRIPGPECQVCETCTTNEITDASRKLIFANIRYDDLNDLYFECLQGNNSVYMEDLNEELNDCEENRDYWKNESTWC